jgi:sarcosine oxidase subunit alpha
VQSPTLGGKVVGLAYVGTHQAAVGTRFNIRIDGGAMVPATVVDTPFYDPKAERQKVS